MTPPNRDRWLAEVDVFIAQFAERAAREDARPGDLEDGPIRALDRSRSPRRPARLGVSRRDRASRPAEN